MDLIEIRREKLLLGMKLNYTLRDDKGAILLAQGHRIGDMDHRGKVHV